MKNPLLILLLLMVVTIANCTAQDPYVAYIDQYKSLAILEERRSGIPASIKMAQALLESGAGQSTLARKANNHFGIKCGNRWDGKTFRRKDDDRNKLGFRVKSCFRVYPDVRSSFIDHSEFLTDPNKQQRYGFLFDIPAKNYKKWARGLKKSGYATNRKYDKLLINLIEKYQLDQLRLDPNEALPSQEQAEEVVVDVPEKDVIKDVEEEAFEPEDDLPQKRYLNEVWYTLAEPGESIDDIADRTGVQRKRIIQYNDQFGQQGQQLTDGQVVFLQLKRNNYRGGKTWHKVIHEETMYDIAQQYGLQLKSLYKRNAMKSGQEPAKGSRIKLNGGMLNLAPPLRHEKVVHVEGGEDYLEMGEETIQPEPTPTEPIFEKPTKQEPIPPKIVEKPAVKEEMKTESPNPSALPDSKPNTTAFPAYYLVKKGDTLWRLSKKFKVTVEQIKSWNNLTSNDIAVGMRLRVG